jgi:uncharacterized protein (DUF58 family)
MSMPPAAASPVRAELARAARLLVLRSRLEATGLFAGNYRSAFRGGGLEYEESRPYAPGDDVRAIDWSATARSGRPFVKLFREERDRTLWLALDVSGSMRWGTAGPSKGAVAAHALALLASAAGRAGDRVGLLAWADGLRSEVPLARGRAQSARVILAAAGAAAQSSGTTDWLGVLAALRRRAPRHAVIVLVSDFRDPTLEAGDGAALRAGLATLARENDVIAAVVEDPREQALVAAGRVRIRDAERPGRSFVLATDSPRVRALFAEAAARRRETLTSVVRGAGAETLWLRCDRSPLFALARFFQERSGRRLGGAR